MEEKETCECGNCNCENTEETCGCENEECNCAEEN